MAVRKMTLVLAMLVCCWACFLVLGALWVADRWVDAIKAEVSFGLTCPRFMYQPL